jgi:hypothetical protein
MIDQTGPAGADGGVAGAERTARSESVVPQPTAHESATGQADGDAVPAGMSQLKVLTAPSVPSFLFCGL